MKILRIDYLEKNKRNLFKFDKICFKNQAICGGNLEAIVSESLKRSLEAAMENG